MESKTKSVEDLDTIRSIMEKSTRFISLSGLSGVFAGLVALAGSAFAYFAVMKGSNDFFSGIATDELNRVKLLIVADALIVLALALASALYFSYRRALRQGMKIWTPVTRRLLLNMLVPLAAGGLFIVVLYDQEYYSLLIPSMLIFYGLALVNAGKFTYGEVFYLGLAEVLTGFVAALAPDHGLLLWTVGFGLLHIIYGLVMYRKYER